MNVPLWFYKSSQINTVQIKKKYFSFTQSASCEINALKASLSIGNKWQCVAYSWHVKIITVATVNRTQRETQRRGAEISIYEMHTSGSHTLLLLRDLTWQSFILRLNWWIVRRHNWDHLDIKHTGRFIKFHIIRTNWKCITIFHVSMYFDLFCSPVYLM